MNHVPAGTAITVQSVSACFRSPPRHPPNTFQGSIQPSLGPVPLTNQFASARFSRTSFKLNPGGTIKFDVTISPPVGINPATFPVYSGFIQVTDGIENLHVSYLGLAASLLNRPILDNTSAFFGFQIPAMVSSTGKVLSGPTTYTFKNGNVPEIIFR